MHKLTAWLVHGRGRHQEVVYDIHTGKDIKLSRGGNRGVSWISKEDELLCDAWMAIIKDTTTGTEQTHGSYWNRVRKDFK